MDLLGLDRERLEDIENIRRMSNLNLNVGSDGRITPRSMWLDEVKVDYCIVDSLMRSVKHRLREAFDLPEKNKVLAIFYLQRRKGTPVQIKTDTDTLMAVSKYPIEDSSSKTQQMNKVKLTVCTQYEIEMLGGEYVSLHMRWEYQVLTKVCSFCIGHIILYLSIFQV